MRLTGTRKQDEDLALAKKVLEWVWRKGNRIVPLVDIYQRGSGPVRTALDAAKIATVLEEHGWFVPAGQRLWKVMEQPVNDNNGQAKR